MLLYVLDLLGVAVFAVSGALAAAQRRLDLFALSGAQIAEADGYPPLVLYMLMQLAGIRRSWAFMAGILSIVVLRVLAIALHWQLPVLASVHS